MNHTRIFIFLMILLCLAGLERISTAGHTGFKGMDDLTVYDYRVFRSPADGSIVCTGSIRSYQCDRTGDSATTGMDWTKIVHPAGCVWRSTANPVTDCIDVWHTIGASRTEVATAFKLSGQFVAKSAINSADAFAVGVVTSSGILDGTVAGVDAVAADFLLPADTTHTPGDGPVATHTWVLSQGFGGAGASASTAEQMSDSIWGPAGDVAAGSHTGITITYDDPGDAVDFDVLLTDENQITDGIIKPKDLAAIADLETVPLRVNSTSWSFIRPANWIGAGTGLSWAGDNATLNASGSSLGEEDVEDISGALMETGPHTAITVTYNDNGAASGDMVFAVGNVTSAEIANGTIALEDMGGGTASINGDFLSNLGDNNKWESIAEYMNRYAASIMLDFLDEIGPTLTGNNADEDGAILYYGAGAHGIGIVIDIDAASYIALDNTIIRPTHMSTIGVIPPGPNRIIKTQDGPGYATAWEWGLASDLFDLGDNLVWADDTTLTLNPAGVNIASVGTVTIQHAAIDTADVGVFAADSVTVAGVRWDNALGRLLPAAIASGNEGQIIKMISGLAVWGDGTSGGSAWTDSVRLGGIIYAVSEYFQADSILGGKIMASTIASKSLTDAYLDIVGFTAPASGEMIWHNGTNWINFGTPTSGDVVKYFDTGMAFAPDLGGAGTMTTVKQDGVQVGGADIVTLDFIGPLEAAEASDTEIDVTLGITANRVLVGDGSAAASVSTISDMFTLDTVNYIDFTTDLSNPTHAEGRFFYDDGEKGLAYYNNSSAVTMQIGREMWTRVKNTTGSQVSDGTVVYLSGATGNVPTIALAKADAASTAMLIGVATMDIANNGFGEVTTSGEVHNIDTSSSGASDGDPVYVSTTTAGEFTSTKPSNTDFPVLVGYVTLSHGATGELLVNPEFPIAEEDINGLTATLADKQAASLATAKVWIGNSDGTASASTVSGHGSIDENGVLTIVNASETQKGIASWDETHFTLSSGQASLADNMTDIYNGAIAETVDIIASSDGVNVTAIFQQDGGGDLTMFFSDGISTFDTTPAVSVALSNGSNPSPTLNYVYILKGTFAASTNTTTWPSEEHAPLATILVQSAASAQTAGVYKMHVWTDHIKDDIDQGHLADVNRWIRQQNATYESGIAQTLTITGASDPDDVVFTTTSGKVFQLHSHTFPAFTGTPTLYTVNHNTTAYLPIDDINEIDEYSDGSSIGNNDRFSLVIWGVVSETTGDCKLMLNLPSGAYNSDNNAIEDAGKKSNYTIPAGFKGAAFLISRLTLKYQTASSGTWTSVDEEDLRGFFPAIGAGGNQAFVSSFADNAFEIFDQGDVTKLLQTELSNKTTGTTTTLQASGGTATILLPTASSTLLSTVTSWSGDLSGTGDSPSVTNDSHSHADGTVADILTLTTISGAVDMGGATSLEIPNSANPTTNAIGEIAVDSNSNGLEVYSASASSSVLIPFRESGKVTIWQPDGVNDEVPIFRADESVYPHGATITKLAISTPANSNYSAVFAEYTMNPPTSVSTVASVSTGGTTYGEDLSPADPDIAVNSEMFLSIPATDVDWLTVFFAVEAKEGN